MFYYISFLRPPPSHASTTPTDPILIAPQISNDLRTALLDLPADIFYAWSLHSPHPASPVSTPPAKLTSWRARTPYKPIPVPPPPHLADGQAWRLVLSCGTARTDPVVPLGEQRIGRAPFAVMSMPVTFARRPGPHAKRAKQEQIARAYVLRPPVPLAHASPIVFDIIEHTSFDLDKKVWDSGIGLSSWIAQLFSARDPATTALSGVRDSLFGTGARNILELGAGTGVVAITLAILRSTLDLSDPPGHIVATDLPSAMPIIQQNVAASRPLMRKCVPLATVLDWDHDELPAPVRLEDGLDVIVMADVTYNTSSFLALLGTLSRLIEFCKSKSNGRPPKILMAYKERHPDERSLWDRAKEIDVHFQKIAQVTGAGGNPVEIWLG